MGMVMVPIFPAGVAVPVPISPEQMETIWPGLDHLMLRYLERDLVLMGITAYPFAIHPLPPGSDSGTFSAAMMNRIGWLWTKLKGQKGGTFELDAFELRAAAFAARVTLQLARWGLRKENNPYRQVLKATASKTDIPQMRESVHQTVEYLETAMKRASRRFMSTAGRTAFRSSGAEWRAHLVWMKYRLTYFKPFDPLLVPLRTMQHRTAALLLQMAEDVIGERGFELPDRQQLRKVIGLFLDYSRRVCALVSKTTCTCSEIGMIR